MDKKDEIILQQLDVIRQMTESSLHRTYSDFWGPSVSPDAKKEEQKGKEDKQITASAGNDAEEKKETEVEPAQSMDELMAELNTYIGLDTIKTEVQNLVNMVKVEAMRKEHGLPTTDMSLHMVFTGNPGTGKSTIARLMAKIYHSLHVLSKGQLIEVDRSGLVAGYVGQTAIKTSKVIESAMGGVLFIDEAYALNGGGDNDFGQEAIDTILKAMEDHRDDLIVIVAGYDELMDKFIHSNPGLESRFNRFLHFEDYSEEELFDIFQMRCNKASYTLADDAFDPLKELLKVESSADPKTFGNARGVRNIFERILVQQANRLASYQQVSKEQLLEITKEDVEKAKKA